MYSSLIPTWWYLDLKSTFENIVAPLSWSSKWSILGKGYFFLIMISFNLL